MVLLPVCFNKSPMVCFLLEYCIHAHELKVNGDKHHPYSPQSHTNTHTLDTGYVFTMYDFPFEWIMRPSLTISHAINCVCVLKCAILFGCWCTPSPPLAARHFLPLCLSWRTYEFWADAFNSGWIIVCKSSGYFTHCIVCESI